MLINNYTSRQSAAYILLPSSLFLIRCRLADIQTETLAVQVDLIIGLLQDLRNVPGVLKLPQIDIRPALLDGVSNQLSRACLTLSTDDCSLLLLAGLVDDKCSALCFLLGDLLSFDSGSEFWRKGKVLFHRC